MQKFLTIFLFLSLFLFEKLESSPSSLANGLDRQSISEHLAYYSLFPNTQEGLAVLGELKTMLGVSDISTFENFAINPSCIESILSLFCHSSNKPLPQISEGELVLLKKIGQNFPNRKLKGYYAATEEEVLELPPEEIDLSRALFLSQLTENQGQELKIYEAIIDLMALQVILRLPSNPTPNEKIAAINHFLFNEMGFRFPPQSEQNSKIDKYSFLPSVIDARRGVCLGISFLYDSIAQRIDLPLTAITPPGHIFLSYRHGTATINIETTARGIRLDDTDYLGIDNPLLHIRSRKEMIGLAHMNHASLFVCQNEWNDALSCYKKAIQYLPNDSQLLELMGLQYIMLGETETGMKILQKAKMLGNPYSINPSTLSEELLENCMPADALTYIMKERPESREEILELQENLKSIIVQYPKCRPILIELALLSLQLQNLRLATEYLETYHEIDPEETKVEALLVNLYLEQYHPNKAWEHFHQLEKILSKHSYYPKIVNELRKKLQEDSPE